MTPQLQKLQVAISQQRQDESSKQGETRSTEAREMRDRLVMGSASRKRDTGSDIPLLMPIFDRLEQTSRCWTRPELLEGGARTP